MQRRENLLSAWILARGSTERAPRSLELVCEDLERRTLLSTGPLLLSRLATIAVAGGSDTVDLPLTIDRLHAPHSGRILFEIEVKPADGSAAAAGAFQIRKDSGAVLVPGERHVGDSMIGDVGLRPGDYGLKIRAQGSETGSFIVLVRMVGDVNGDHEVDHADLGEIRAAINARHSHSLRPVASDSSADVNGDGAINVADLALARRDVGASAQATITLFVKDDTKGAYQPNQIFVAITGLNPNNQYSHLNPTGQLIPMQLSDNTAPGHLSKNGVDYSNYFFTLDQVSQGIDVPFMPGGRIWIGAGSPLYFQVNTNNLGQIAFTQPNVGNSSDPNLDLYFDFIEFTLTPGGFFGNTTQVDQFGIPLTLELQSQNIPTAKVGITEPRQQILQEYAASVIQAFQPLLTAQAPFRILAPKKGIYSQANNPTYFDSYIADVWSFYQTHDLVLTNVLGTFTGRVINNVLTFTKNGDTSQTKYLVQRPQSWEVFASAGVLATGNAIELALEAQISAGFNRHVATLDFSSMGNPALYYQTAPANFYAQFWHQHSINALAYGFDYDDVFNQSSTVTSAKPTILTVSVGWN
jgi:Beta-1,3-glucanase/Dockerin type I domain